MITTRPGASMEAAKDALVGLLIGPEFAKFLDAEHAAQAVKIQLRYPEVGYITEVKTLGGYPAVELVSGPTDYADGGTGLQRERELSVQWTVNGDNEQTMEREIARLTEATVQFIEKNNGSLLPWVGGRWRVSRDDTGPTSEGRDDPFVKSSSVRLIWNIVG